MSRQNETGHAVNAANFYELVALCTGLGNRYNPSHPSMTISQLSTMKTAVENAMNTHGASKELSKQDVAKRREAFEKNDAMATMWHQALVGARVKQTVLDRAASIIGKIKGERLTDEPEPGITPSAEGAPPPQVNTISTSQQGFDNVVNNILAYTQLLDTVSDYNPNEADVTKTGIKAYYQLLNTLNVNAINSTQQNVSARSERDRLLYTDENSVYNVAKSIKSYVKSSKVILPAEKKQILDLSFRTLSKRTARKKK